MDIQNIINDLAAQLQGTNALIQIQVEDQYYIRIIGDSSRLSMRICKDISKQERTMLDFFKSITKRKNLCNH